ncbi:pyridoxal phosphate-dependent transferase [Xylariaceae sp. FL0255]|nr:pyridoxal phosphate-dependent transferase [Xylariaceae sp. FL0255]
MPSIDIGDSIPSNTAHAVSVSLPTWQSNIDYEEGDPLLKAAMVTGYPRFFVHKSICALGKDILARHAPQSHLDIMLFPTLRIAQRCHDYVRRRAPSEMLSHLTVLHLVLDPECPAAYSLRAVCPSISAVICHEASYPLAKEYWQHSGEGVSSRRAEFCHTLFRQRLLIPDQAPRSPSPPSTRNMRRGPKRYQRGLPDTDYDELPDRDTADSFEASHFLEERFGRNLDVSLAEKAKSAIKRRIAGVLAVDIDLTTKSMPAMTDSARGVSNLHEDDIYLTSTGMMAIFTAHQALLRARDPQKSISYGFPYVDTLKILQKFGPGALFYGHGSEADLDDLEIRLHAGEKFLGLFCEFPGNPLLTCPNLIRIRTLADKYDFAVVVDETLGNFINVNVLPQADMVVSSLTKIFSGDCNVMGGSLVLNPTSRYYAAIKRAMAEIFEDTYWVEDIVFMERNSRDFITRIDRVNSNAEAICAVLHAHPLVTNVHYPKYNTDRPNYEALRLPDGGYGGLLSCTLKTKAHAVAFYDALETAKGPSLGTNFTLTSPYVLLAHYNELEWAAGFGVDASLLRISVGLENNLSDIFAKALEAAEKVS